MAADNPMLDDVAKLMTGALGVAQSAGEEARTAMRSQVERAVSGLDLANRDEVDALKSLLQTAMERIERLEARIAELEAKSGG